MVTRQNAELTSTIQHAIPLILPLRIRFPRPNLLYAGYTAKLKKIFNSVTTSQGAKYN